MSVDLAGRLIGVAGATAEALSWNVDFGAPVPVISPADEPALVEVLRFAGRERLAVVPIGRGSKLSWTRFPTRVDFALSTRRLTGLVDYVPAEGTLTARAGTPWSELESAARRSGHHLSPTISQPARATLGGVLAAGQSGTDRLRYGPVRHQVLGTRVVLADGSSAKSGGRLVKNVTGFDLHRLHTGSFGTLCVIVEASLRLYPEPRARAVALASFASRPVAMAAASAILTTRARPLVVTCHDLGAAGRERSWTLMVVLAGSPNVIAWESATLKAAVAELHVFGGEEHRSPCDLMAEEMRDLERCSGEWPHLQIECLPMRLEATLAALDAAARAAELEVRVLAHPGIATVSLWLRARSGGEPDEDGARRFESALESLDARRHWRNAPPIWRRAVNVFGAPPPGLALMQRIKEKLDPAGVFAPGRFVGTW